MALIRQLNSNENTINYIGTVAFFCVISCTIIMLRFGGFKATFNLLSKGKKSDIEEYEKAPGEPICGAYRISRDEFYTNARIPDPPKKITPDMVQLPPSRTLKPSKSTDDVTKPITEPSVVHKSTPDVSREPQQNTQNKNQVKGQKSLEKQQRAEQKKRDKAAAKEQQKEEKLRKEREKQAQRSQGKEDKSKKSRTCLAKPLKGKKPLPIQQPASIEPSVANNPEQPIPTRFSTNTLESSISRSSGPPPYSATADAVPNRRDNTGNTSFEPKEDSGSWDMISQHKRQMKRNPVVKDITKQTHLDLQYNAGTSNVTEIKNISDV